MKNVLLVDDDGEAVLSLIRALKASGIDAPLHAASTQDKALSLIKELDPYVVVLDLHLDPAKGVESGFSVLKSLTLSSPATKVIVLTGHGSSEFGIRALELGAAHFLQKPADILHLRVLIQDGIAQSSLKREYLSMRAREGNAENSPLIGISKTAEKIREQILFAAKTAQSVLILGETGTGKGLCAREIHRLSARSGAKFIRYQPNFGTSDLISSELFGHMKGAFTGALETRKGLIVESDKGTLFLDEVDQLPKETQVALLGVLQDKVIRAVGSNTETGVNFRLITASNADIKDKIRSGSFREDLFHRIAHLVIHLPPLKDRKEDIEPLAGAVLQNLQRREGISSLTLSPAALFLLSKHEWPGNIRELEAVIEGAAYRAAFRGAFEIDAEDIAIRGAESSPQTTDSFAERVESYKRKLVDDALIACGGNQVKASELLQLDRSTLRRIIERVRNEQVS